MKSSCLLFAFFLIVLTSCERDSTEIIKNPYERGLSLASEGKFLKAEKAFKSASKNTVNKRAIEESLDVVEDVLSRRLDREVASLFFKGVKDANEGQILRAYSYLSNVIKKDPDFPHAYYERGLVNGRMKMYENAVSDFTKVINLNPTDAAAFNNRGLAYAKGLSEYDKAIRDFSKAIEIDAQFAEAYDNRGIAFMKKLDDNKQACSDWQRACELKRCNSYEQAKRNNYCK